MSGTTSGPTSPASRPEAVASPVTGAPDAAASGTQTMSMDDFDALNRVVSQALGICDAVQASSELGEQHASALWAAVDLLQLGRGILQRYALAPRHHG